MAFARRAMKLPGSSQAISDRRLLRLVAVALGLSVGHHFDHVIRGNHVGWPVTADVNAFTASLGIYPLILGGLALWRAGRVGPGGWAFLAGGGAVFLATVHVGPWAIEPPRDIIAGYDRPLVGWLAFGWLLTLVAVLVVAAVYELHVWWRQRNAGTE